MKLSLSTFVFLAVSSTAFAGNVLVVGPLPTQIAEIQAAIDVAVDGDVILVKGGAYASFSVPNKSVTIVAEAGHSVNIYGAMRVRNLSAERSVVLSGMHATGQLGSPNVAIGNGFFAGDCAGSIRVQDCVLEGYLGWVAMPCPSVPRQGAQLENCADVAFVRCTITGSGFMTLFAAQPGDSAASREGQGLVATGSSLALHECTIRGGADGYLCNGYNDGAGVALHSSFLYATNTVMTGGRGANASGFSIYAGWGGNGLEIYDLSSHAHLLHCSLSGAAGGMNNSCGLFGYCCNGEAGYPYAGPGVALDTLSGTGRVLMANDLARESTTLTLTVTGPAGDVAALGIQRATGFDWQPARFGVQLLSPAPMRFMILGTIPASGTLSTSLALPSIPLADPGQVFHLQLITSGSTPVSHLGTPLSLAILDAAY